MSLSRIPSPHELPAKGSRMNTFSNRSFRDLVSMLEYKRPHGSKTERKFINRFIKSLPVKISTDGYGNLFAVVGDNPDVMWCAHTDTVHTTPGKQRVELSADGTHIYLPAGERSNCLGADNAAGVWMLRELILANVPGLYCFFRNEELGGLGSQYFASTHGDLLTGIKYAIAFDRRGTESIITWQVCGRSCSDAFAVALAKQLGMGHSPDDGGTFTDTASFVDIIPECTNVSVGFKNEHNAAEILNVSYLFALRDAMLNVSVSDLPAERAPGDDGYDDLPWNNCHTPDYHYRAYRSEFDAYNDDGSRSPPSRRGSLIDLLRDHPDAVASLLTEMGITAASLARELDEITGYQYEFEERYN